MKTTAISWQPTTTNEVIKLRAKLLKTIREFFEKRTVLEVETPLLCQHTVTDLHIESFKTQYHNGSQQQTYYLQTSPEYAMKRLLASGSGPLFQICKAFRNGEHGNHHNPEFTLLEWYRPGFNHHDLMKELDALVQIILNTAPALKITYQQLFEDYCSINPHQCDLNTLLKLLKKNKIAINNQSHLDEDTCLQLLLSHVIEPQLPKTAPLFIYDFPATQAALATIRDEHPRVAERFELYIDGQEIANGFHELIDANEQLERFNRDQIKRRLHNKWVPEIDPRLIAAIDANIPQCSGVAVGLDRLLMLLSKRRNIKEVINFPWERA